ncbi:hypothetical protein [Sporomusa acidovorans]|uniref:hypothetical protein n=1 Tax=Sporomusa acidovorans TaxID=112900 RepID=UPI0011604AE8|nr:hypothetical protein [Sporomusa acidovorans]
MAKANKDLRALPIPCMKIKLSTNNNQEKVSMHTHPNVQSLFLSRIRKDLACAKSFRTPAEALVALTYYQKGYTF